MWKRELQGRRLWFRLAALNNQNFIMEDEETGTWWQQVSGEALRGPFEGERLELVRSDEISLGLWKQELRFLLKLYGTDPLESTPLQIMLRS